MDLGFFNKEATLDDLIDCDMIRYFMPHSLGHYIGHKVHDVGL